MGVNPLPTIEELASFHATISKLQVSSSTLLNRKSSRRRNAEWLKVWNYKLALFCLFMQAQLVELKQENQVLEQENQQLKQQVVEERELIAKLGARMEKIEQTVKRKRKS